MSSPERPSGTSCCWSLLGHPSGPLGAHGFPPGDGPAVTRRRTGRLSASLRLHAARGLRVPRRSESPRSTGGRAHACAWTEARGRPVAPVRPRTTAGSPGPGGRAAAPGLLEPRAPGLLGSAPPDTVRSFCKWQRWCQHLRLIAGRQRLAALHSENNQDILEACSNQRLLKVFEASYQDKRGSSRDFGRVAPCPTLFSPASLLSAS